MWCVVYFLVRFIFLVLSFDEFVCLFLGFQLFYHLQRERCFSEARYVLCQNLNHLLRSSKELKFLFSFSPPQSELILGNHHSTTTDRIRIFDRLELHPILFYAVFDWYSFTVSPNCSFSSTLTQFFVHALVCLSTSCFNLLSVTGRFSLFSFPQGKILCSRNDVSPWLPPFNEYHLSVCSLAYLEKMHKSLRVQLNPLSTDFSASRKAQVWPSHSKSNISTTTSATTTLDTPLERSSHCASNNEKYYENLFKRLRYIVLSEGSRLPRTETENPIILCLCSSYEVRSSPVDSLDPCRHLLYTFLDVSSYHSNGVSEVAAASHIVWVTSSLELGPPGSLSYWVARKGPGGQYK